MKMKLLFLAAFILLTSAITDNSPVTIYMVGDSTMANRNLAKSPRSKERGWGMMLGSFFPTDKVVVANHATSGRSTKSFIDEKRWTRVVKQIKPGDYVFIQFGHNDEKKDNPKLHTEPGGTFDDNLRKFVNETRAKGGIPVLFNSIVRRKFCQDEAGNFTNSLSDTHGDYLLSPKRIAEELNVVFIDMNKMTHDLVQQMGPEKSKELYMWAGKKDDTHLNIKGSRVFAGMAIDAVGKKIPELGKYIRHFDYVVATDGSGDFFTLDEALKAIPAKKKCTVLVRIGQYSSKPEIKNKLIKITEDEGVTYGSPVL